MAVEISSVAVRIGKVRNSTPSELSFREFFAEFLEDRASRCGGNPIGKFDDDAVLHAGIAPKFCFVRSDPEMPAGCRRGSNISNDNWTGFVAFNIFRALGVPARSFDVSLMLQRSEQGLPLTIEVALH